MCESARKRDPCRRVSKSSCVASEERGWDVGLRQDKEYPAIPFL